MRRATRHLAPGLLLLALGLPLLGPGPAYPHGGESHDAPQGAEPVPMAAGTPISVSKESQFLLKIRTAVAAQRTVTQQLSAQGKVVARPQSVADVFSPVAGRVVTGAGGLRVGMQVKRGQTLAAVEQVLSTPERLSVRTDLAKTEAELAQTEVDLRLDRQGVRLAEQEAALARKTVERLRSVSAVVPGKEIAAAEMAYLQASNRVVQARGEVQRAQAQLTSLRRQRASFRDVASAGGSRINRYALTAPIGGVITEVHATRGEQVSTEQALFEIMDLGTVWVESAVYEDDLPLVEQARAATITAPAYPGLVRQGRLVNVGQKIDPETRTAKVTFEVPNPGNRLRVGMFVNQAIPTRRLAKRVAIPAIALYERGDKTWVFVHATAETFQQRLVTPGERVKDVVVVTSGVRPGERVVVQGAHQLFAAAATGPPPAAPTPPAPKPKG